MASGERPSPLPAEQHAVDLAPAFRRDFACNQSVGLKADVTKRLAPRLAALAAGRPTVMTSTGFTQAILESRGQNTIAAVCIDEPGAEKRQQKA